MIFSVMGLAFIDSGQKLYGFFTRYAAVRPIAFTGPPLSSHRSTPETLMLDVAYLAGLLIAYGLFYGFSYVCSRL